MPKPVLHPLQLQQGSHVPEPGGNGYDFEGLQVDLGREQSRGEGLAPATAILAGHN